MSASLFFRLCLSNTLSDILNIISAFPYDTPLSLTCSAMSGFPSPYFFYFLPSAFIVFVSWSLLIDVLVHPLFLINICMRPDL